MKKTVSILSAASGYLLLASQAFADIQISVAPPTGALHSGDNSAVSRLPQFIINLLFIVGVLAAVIYLIYGGVKWIISGGDKAAVDSARNHIVAAIIGLIVLAAAFFVINVVFALLGVQNPLANGFSLPQLQP